jgi:CSLREA domain-containing protein
MRNLVTALTIITLSPITEAATFTVNTTSDLATDNCTGGACSLRGAITAANATTAADTIAFNIPNSDPGFQTATQSWLILVPAIQLPRLEQAVVIDGYTQPGAVENTNTPDQGGLNGTLKIELRAPTPPPGSSINGLEVDTTFTATGPSVIRGLAISLFQSQVLMGGLNANRIEGCYLGTNILGTQAATVVNGVQGLGVRTSWQGGYIVGGTDPAARNLISGMRGGFVAFSANNNVRIQGNLIGTNAAGTAAIANDDGITLDTATNTLIGGTDPNARNVISGNRFSAVNIFSTSTVGAFAGLRIEGNFIGTDVSGRLPLGNGVNLPSPTQSQPTFRIFTGTAAPLQIGGLAPGQANLIAFGGSAGAHLGGGRGAQGSFNRYLGNRGIAWDNSGPNTSGEDGPSPNDVNDLDEGANRSQNFPVLTVPANFLPAGGASVALQYQVDTALANATYPITVNFFRGGCGGGPNQFIGSDTISAAQAQSTKNFTLTPADGGNVLPLVANAVDADGNQSEFTAMVGDVILRSDLEDVQAALTTGRCF